MSEALAPKIKKKTGRPPKFSPEEFGPAVLEKLPEPLKICKSDAKIAEILGVDPTTFSFWKRNNPQFFVTYNMEMYKLNHEVEMAMYKNATGYSHPEIRTATFNGQITDTVEVTKHYPPNERAGIFWLTNRDPERWKREQDMMPQGHNIQVNFNFPRPDYVEQVKTDAGTIPAARKNV